ncbi:pentatricopeptide repeat-containing protein At2g13600-like [Syzygium oleosum]|uniref:pentatricopeptide repeat-containing protein At2g13600-like n=1 Tax=Syzygium oleosum TaxID=219896 RepID=UPI0024BA6920|nr:pentatricopeptide repeat-containing protein At2g13600-like [Syzygium oleosum]
MAAHTLEPLPVTVSPTKPPSLGRGSGDGAGPRKATAIPFPRGRRARGPTHAAQLSHRTHLTLLDGPVDSCAYAAILEPCGCPNLGRQVHGHALKCGFRGHEFVETKLLQMYGKCGRLDDAFRVFDGMPQRNLYSWAGIIGACLDHGFSEEGLLLFRELQLEDIELEFFLFPIAMKMCSGLDAVELGRQMHGMVIKYQHLSNIYVCNALIDMYGKCGSLEDAKRVLESMPQRDRVSWNSVITACIANGMVYEALEYLEKMLRLDSLVPNLVSWSAVIGGFAQNGYDEEAIDLLARMIIEGFEPNARTLASVLPSCARLQELKLGREIHGYITRHKFMSNSYVVNGLVDVYRRCRDVRSAENMFEYFSVQNEVAYNTMMVAYLENGEISKARALFNRMEQQGVKKSTISWNSLISGYVDNSLFHPALELYLCMLSEEGVQPDSFTLGSVVTACANMASLRQGKEIHSHAIALGLHSSPFVGGALVEMYSKCHDIIAARLAFDQVAERDTTTWNALISGYSHCDEIENIQRLLERMKQDDFEPNIYTWNSIFAGYVENGHHDSAMILFSDMQSSSLRPDAYTIAMILTASSRLGTMDRGKQCHAYSIRSEYESDVYIGAALVDMYAKSGSFVHAMRAYDKIANPNLVSHNAMLTAYAMHGLGEEGISLFRRILVEGCKPDHVTFLSVLSCCVHAGTVETGCHFFDLMACYNVKPTLKHYTCMVDLLGRAGQLSEAYELIVKMPVEPDAVVWSALLGGCVICCNVDVGEIAAQKLIELEPDNAGNYTLLANLYAHAGRWSDLARIRRMMKDRGMHKRPGYSWIEDRDHVHVFLACDMSHDRTYEIYDALDTLSVHMKKGFGICL